jgi:hypothetical protein
MVGMQVNPQPHRSSGDQILGRVVDGQGFADDRSVDHHHVRAHGQGSVGRVEVRTQANDLVGRVVRRKLVTEDAVPVAQQAKNLPVIRGGLGNDAEVVSVSRVRACVDLGPDGHAYFFVVDVELAGAVEVDRDVAGRVGRGSEQEGGEDGEVATHGVLRKVRAGLALVRLYPHSCGHKGERW